MASDFFDQLSIDFKSNAALVMRDIRGVQDSMKSLARTGTPVIDGISKGFDSLQQSFKNVGSSLADLTRGMAVWTAGLSAAALGIGAGAHSLLMLADAAEDTNEKLDALFGDSSGKVRAWAKSFGDAAGRSARVLQSEVLNTGQFLTGLGFGPDQAAEVATMLSQRGADLAGKKGGSAAEWTESLRKSLIGQDRDIAGAGIVISEADEQAERLRLGYAKLADEATAAEKAHAKFNLVMRASEEALGSAAKEAGDYSAQWDQFMERLGDSGALIGSIALEPAAAGLKAINDAIRDTNSAFGPLVEDAKEFASQIANVVSAVAQDPSLGFELWLRGVDALREKLMQLADELSTRLSEAISAGIKNGLGLGGGSGASSWAGWAAGMIFGGMKQVAPGTMNALARGGAASLTGGEKTATDRFWSALERIQPTGKGLSTGDAASKLGKMMQGIGADALAKGVTDQRTLARRNWARDSKLAGEGLDSLLFGFSGSSRATLGDDLQGWLKAGAGQAIAASLQALISPDKASLSMLAKGSVDVAAAVSGGREGWKGGQILSSEGLHRALQEAALKTDDPEKKEAKRRDEARNTLLDKVVKATEATAAAIKNPASLFSFE